LGAPSLSLNLNTQTFRVHKVKSGWRLTVEEKIKRYIHLQEKAKLALIKSLTESQSIDMQMLQTLVASKYYAAKASYVSNLIYQSFESLRNDKIVNLEENKPKLSNLIETRKVLSSEKQKIAENLSGEWGLGDFKFMGDFCEAIHILAQLVMRGSNTNYSEIMNSLEDDVYEGLGAFKNLSSSQQFYRRSVIIPRTIKLLEELKIIEEKGTERSIIIDTNKLCFLLTQYSNEIFQLTAEITIAQKKKIMGLIKLSKLAKESAVKSKEENALLTAKSRNLADEVRTKENKLDQYSAITSFIERTKIIGIDINWVITCAALNLVETAIKKKLMDMGVSRDKVLNKEFEENSKLLEKLLLEQEGRRLTSRLLFNDVYKKARAKIDHAGHLHKPSSRECTYIIDETVDFIDELFKVSNDATSIIPSTGKWNPLPVIKFNIMGIQLKRKLPQIGWELINHSPYQLKIRIEVHPWLGKKDLFSLIKDPHINGEKSYNAEPNNPVWGNGTFTLPGECVDNKEELVIEIRSFVTDVNEPKKGEHKMLPSVWKYVRNGDYWYYYPQGP
jgi:hypothetical protein